MRTVAIIIVFISVNCWAQFDPAGGEPGSKSIHKDATSIIGWATNAEIERGFVQINETSLGKSTVGDKASAIGAMDGLVVSLGDGGEAILTFAEPITNRSGYDFAVFENGFKVGLSYYLELAHVEVSKDGINYVRFPSETVSDTSYQVDNFGYLKPTDIYNLAGKHQAPYGTLFDLEEVGLDTIRYVKLIDVIGTIDSALGSRDSKGKIINDPFPSPFESGGFDLDAVAVVNGELLNVQDVASSKIELQSNRVSKNELVRLVGSQQSEIQVFDALGANVYSGYVNQFSLPTAGMYFVQITQNAITYTRKVCVY
jgi:hypothetical protein